MKIAFVGDVANHGKYLKTPGTSIVILLSALKGITSVDVYCPIQNTTIEQFEPPYNVRIIQLYEYNKPSSLFRLLKIDWNDYDFVIFNMLSTGFGSSSLPNAIWLAIPIILVKFLRLKNIRVIYHNSVYTNDIVRLGYNSPFDKVRSLVLAAIERSIFKSIKTFVFLKLYKQRIDTAIGKNKVSFLHLRYLDAVATIYANSAMDVETLEAKESDVPTILMHGSWGPQKNIESGLLALRRLKESGIDFRLIISGGLNSHFSEYKKGFNNLINEYYDIINNYKGYVEEKEVMNLFLKSDILILPYNVPGGMSGVLDQAIFFDIPTIAVDFPEYREQTIGVNNVKLVSLDHLTNAVKEALTNYVKKRKIANKEKLHEAVTRISEIIKQ